MAYVLWPSVAGFEEGFLPLLGRQVSGVWAGVAVGRMWYWGGEGARSLFF